MAIAKWILENGDRKNTVSLTRILSSALLYCISCSVAAAAEDKTSQFAADRIKLEERIASILYEKSVALPPSEQGAQRQIQTFFTDEHTDGRLLKESTAVFEGCVLVVRIVDHAPVRDIGWRQVDRRMNLAFILTEPSRVEIAPVSVYAEFGLPQSSVSFGLKPEIEERLRPMQRLASDILNQAFTLFPSDVAARLPWLAKRYREELTDNIFLDAGDHTYYVDGTEIVAPSDIGPIYLIRKELAASFVDLIHQYQTNYCGDTVDA